MERLQSDVTEKDRQIRRLQEKVDDNMAAAYNTRVM